MTMMMFSPCSASWSCCGIVRLRGPTEFHAHAWRARDSTRFHTSAVLISIVGFLPAHRVSNRAARVLGEDPPLPRCFTCKNLERFDGSRYDATPPAVLGRLVRSCRQRANVHDRGRQVYQGWEALPDSVRKVGLRARDCMPACTLPVSHKLVVRPAAMRAGCAFPGRAACGCCGVELAVCPVRCWRV